MFHGTWAYAVRCIMTSHTLFASWDEALGHEEHCPGAYTTRTLKNAWGYARPIQLFGDYSFYQFAFRCAPLREPKAVFDTQGVQEVYDMGNVVPIALLVKINAFQEWWYGQEIVISWTPLLEVHKHRLPSVLQAEESELSTILGMYPRENASLLRKAIKDFKDLGNTTHIDAILGAPSGVPGGAWGVPEGLPGGLWGAMGDPWGFLGGPCGTWRAPGRSWEILQGVALNLEPPQAAGKGKAASVCVV